MKWQIVSLPLNVLLHLNKIKSFNLPMPKTAKDGLKFCNACHGNNNNQSRTIDKPWFHEKNNLILDFMLNLKLDKSSPLATKFCRQTRNKGRKTCPFPIYRNLFCHRTPRTEREANISPIRQRWDSQINKSRL